MSDLFTVWDWVLLTTVTAWGIVFLATGCADLLAVPLYKTRTIYARIYQHLAAPLGKAMDTVEQFKSKLDHVDYSHPEWRRHLLRVLQEASEDNTADDYLTRLISNRLGDAVRKTAEIVNDDQRRALIDATKLMLSDFPAVTIREKGNT